MVRIGWVLLLLLSPAQDEVVREHVAQLRSDRAAVREEGERALRRIGPAALPALRAAARDADPDVAGRASRLVRIVEAVELVGPRLLEKTPGAEHLIASRDDSDWTALFLRAHVLPGIADAAMDALAPRALAGARAPAGPRDPNSEPVDERRSVARIIAERRLRSAVPGLIALLASPDAEARESAVLALGHLRVASAVPAIRRILHDSDGTCRAAAATALGAIGSVESIPDLAVAVTDSSYAVSARARDALQQISPAAAIAELGRLLDRKPLPYRSHVIIALDVLRNSSRDRYGSYLHADELDDAERSVLETLTDIDRPDAVDRLVPLLRDPRKAVRKCAVQILARLGDRRAGPDLVPLLRDADEEIRLTAVNAVGEMEVAEAADNLIALLEDPGPYVQARAAHALGRLNCVKARPKLLALLTRGSPEARKHVAWSFDNLVRPEDTPAILDSIEEVEPDVRDCVVRVLWKVAPASALSAIARSLGERPGGYWNPESVEGPRRAEFVAALRQLLLHAELPVRRGALFLASKGGFKETTPEISKLAEDPDAELRAEAVCALGGFLQRKSIATLVGKIKDENEAVRNWACWKLAELGAGDQAVPELIRFLADRGYDRHIVEALEQLGTRDAVPALTPFLKKQAPLIRLHATTALARLQSPPSPEVIGELMEDHDLSVQRRTIDAITSLKIRDAIPHLRAAVKRGEPDVLFAAIDALGRLGATDAAADLIPLLEDDDYQLRASAARALGRLGNRRAIPPLRMLLADHEFYARQSAAAALGELGAAEAVPDLLRLLRAEAERGWTAWGAIEAMEALGVREAVPDLTRILQEEIRSQNRPSASLSALKRLDPAAAGRSVLQLLDREETVRRRFPNALVQLQRGSVERRGCHYEPPPPWRVLAIQALAELGTVDAIPTLRGFLNDRDEEVRHASAIALLRLASADRLSEIAEFLRNPDSEVRSAAVKRMGVLGDRERMASVLPLLRDSASEVRRAAVPVLARLGGPEATAHLRPLLEDRDRWVRLAAAASLCRLGEPAGVSLLLEEGAGLSALNGLRDPAACRRLAETRLAGPLAGTTREILAGIARQAGMTLELPAVETLPVTAILREPRTLTPDEAPTLLDALELLLPRGSLAGYLLSDGTLRILSRGAEWSFWETWSEQAKR